MALIAAHCRFCSCYELGIGRVAERQIPCAHAACRTQLNKPWDMNVDKACGQEKFQTPDECFSKDTSENHNDWKMLSTQPSPDANEDEVMDLVDDVPGAFEAAAAREVQIGGFGACGAEDGHHIVQFKSEPHALEADSEDVEGVDLIAAASMIWEAVCWNPCAPVPSKKRMEETVHVWFA